MVRFVLGLMVALAIALSGNLAQAGRGCDKNAKSAEPAKAVASTADANEVSKLETRAPSQIALAQSRSGPMVQEVCARSMKQKGAAVAVNQQQEALKFVQTLPTNPTKVNVDKKVIVKNVRTGPIGRLLGIDKPSVNEKDRVVVRN